MTAIRLLTIAALAVACLSMAAFVAFNLLTRRLSSYQFNGRRSRLFRGRHDHTAKLTQASIGSSVGRRRRGKETRQPILPVRLFDYDHALIEASDRIFC
jgi:hypothetical protein